MLAEEQTTERDSSNFDREDSRFSAGLKFDQGDFSVGLSFFMDRCKNSIDQIEPE